MIITHTDLRAFKYCNVGAREFFERHGFDWSDFVFKGIPEEKMLGTGDAMAVELVAFAKERKGG